MISSICKNAKMQKCKNAKMQKYKNAKMQKLQDVPKLDDKMRDKASIV